MSIELHLRFGLEGFPRIRDWEGEGDQEPQETSCLCLKMLCAYISAVFWVYLYIPCMDIYLCFSSLVRSTNALGIKQMCWGLPQPNSPLA